MDVYSKYLKYKKKFLALKAGAAPAVEAPVVAAVLEAQPEAPAQAPIPEIVVVEEEPQSPFKNLNEYLGDRSSANIIAVVSLLQNEELYFFVCTARVLGYLEYDGFVFPNYFRILIPIRKKYFNPEDMINPDINLLKRKFDNPEILSQTTAFVLYNETASAHQPGAHIRTKNGWWCGDICVETTLPYPDGGSRLLTLLEYINNVKKLDYIEKGQVVVQDISALVEDLEPPEPIRTLREQGRSLPTIEFPAVPPDQPSRGDFTQGVLGLNKDSTRELGEFLGTNRKP